MTQVTSSDPLSNPDHTVEHTSLNTRANDLGDILMGLSGLSDAASSISSFVNGSITLSKLASDLVNLLVPAGTIVGWPATGSIPDGWLALGQTIANADTTYPSLWAVAPSAWKSGSNLILPDPYRRMLKGLTNETPGTTGGTTVVGSTFVINTSASNLPSHTHSLSNHTHLAGTSANHTHSLDSHTHTYTMRQMGGFTRLTSGSTLSGYASNNGSNTLTTGNSGTANAPSTQGYIYGGTSNNPNVTTSQTRTSPNEGLTEGPTGTAYYDGGLSRLWNYLLIKAH